MGPVDGDKLTMNSTRAERAGFLGPLSYVSKIVEKYSLKEGSIIMHVGNTSEFNHCAPPQAGEGALRHLCDDYVLKKLKEICEESYNQYSITFLNCRSPQGVENSAYVQYTRLFSELVL